MSFQTIADKQLKQWASVLQLLTRPLNTVRPELVEGHSTACFDWLSPNGKPVIKRAGLITLLAGLAVFNGQANAELLGRISDDTAPAASPSAPAAAVKNNGRNIIYRVICSPEDNDLPDCDRSALDDGNEAGQAVAVPDFPPNSDATLTEQEQAAPPKPFEPEKQQKSARKKAATHKKSAKKAAAKKPAGKKRSRK